MRPLISFAAAAMIAVIISSSVPALTPNTSLIVLEYGESAYEYTDEYPSPPDFTIAEDYQERGIGRKLSERMSIVDDLIAGGSNTKEALLYCFPLLERTVEKALADVRLEPVDGEIRFMPDSMPMFEIRRSVPGYRLEESRVYSDIYFALRRGVKRVALSPVAVLPSVTAEELSAYTRLRARFTTSYSTSTASRAHNIALAMSKINGTTLMPGQTFSFNNIVGKRTTANGFESAKIIMDGEYTEGVGGGVCQASTTVYNAALMAGMRITAVNRHTLVPTYVDPSFDAMVNGSGSDLKFINTGDGPVFVRTYAKGGTAVAEIYSSQLPYKLSLRSETVSVGERPADKEFVDTERTYTEGMASGEKVRISGGAPAVRSNGYLVIEYQDGRREEHAIRSDSYAAAAGRIAIAP